MFGLPWCKQCSEDVEDSEEHAKPHRSVDPFDAATEPIIEEALHRRDERAGMLAGTRVEAAVTQRRHDLEHRFQCNGEKDAWHHQSFHSAEGKVSSGDVRCTSSSQFDVREIACHPIEECHEKGLVYGVESCEYN